MLAVPSIQSPRVQLTGSTGQRVRIQRSTNLLDWEDWQSVTLDSTTLELTDDPAGTVQRFYRAVDDHSDELPPNSPATADLNLTGRTWLPGDALQHTVEQTVHKGLFCPYLDVDVLYRCPTDQQWIQVQGQKRLRPFHSGLSGYLQGRWIELAPELRKFTVIKTTEIRRPSQTMVLIEEHEEYNRGAMAFIVPPGESFWVTPIGDRHQQGANLLFTDTHAEYWKWRFPKGPQGQPPANPLDQQDLARLQTTIPNVAKGSVRELKN